MSDHVSIPTVGHHSVKQCYSLDLDDAAAAAAAAEPIYRARDCCLWLLPSTDLVQFGTAWLIWSARQHWFSWPPPFPPAVPSLVCVLFLLIKWSDKVQPCLITSPQNNPTSINKYSNNSHVLWDRRVKQRNLRESHYHSSLFGSIFLGRE